MPAGVRAQCHAPEGLLTGLVCDDPAAADALARLPARETDPSHGRILVGGTDLAALPLDVVRATVLVSPHEAALLPGTVAENMTALTEDRNALSEAAWASFADQVVAATPQGAHTSVGDRSEPLSGGQRRRVALGQALATRPPVPVPHEPTTAVDTVAEDAIAARVRGARVGRTTLVVTNSPAWLTRCDHVVHMSARGSRIPDADPTPPRPGSTTPNTGPTPARPRTTAPRIGPSPVPGTSVAPSTGPTPARPNTPRPTAR